MKLKLKKEDERTTESENERTPSPLLKLLSEQDYLLRKSKVSNYL